MSIYGGKGEGNKPQVGALMGILTERVKNIDGKGGNTHNQHILSISTNVFLSRISVVQQNCDYLV